MSTEQKNYLKKGILYSLMAVILFCSGYLLGALTNSVTATVNKPVAVVATAEATTTTMPETTTPPTTVAPTTTEPTTTEPTTETTTTTESTTESTTQGENQGTEERVFNCFLIEIKVNALEAIRDLLNIDFVTSIIDAIVSFCMTVDSLFA